MILLVYKNLGGFKMKDIWVLTIKTSLPNVCEDSKLMESTHRAFSSFAKAKEVLRENLKELSSKNSMFDENGDIIHFNNYIKDSIAVDELDDPADDLLTQSELKEIHLALKAVFNGETYFPELREYYDDYMIGVSVSEDTISLYGTCDGPINGINPNISSNMFDMSEEKDYHLYIDDMFDQEISSELYIDLNKVTLEE